MNSKERMLKTFQGEKTDTFPVAPHWWGKYKYQLAGIASGFEDLPRCWAVGGAELAEVDSLFYETFKPDWFHLNYGPNVAKGDEYAKRKIEELKQKVRLLDSKAVIDEYVDAVYMSADEMREASTYEHVSILSTRYGNDVFIAMNEGNPICRILDPNGTFGFEEGLIALAEKPDMMEYLIFREYEMMLEKIKVLKECGCHGFIGSETYCSGDLISPAMYRNLIFPAQKFFYEEVGKTGMVPITYFLGDIRPLINDINKLGVAALMVEESKKNFKLDVVDIRKKLSENITLFGNIDSVYTLLYGSRAEVVKETIKELEAAKYGKFITANGSPIAFNTLKENLSAMISAVRENS
jgi:uroporphyrinogen-III decarboxylase